MTDGYWRIFLYLVPELIQVGGVLAILIWGMLFPRKESPGQSLFVLLVLTASLFALVLGPSSNPGGQMLAAGGLTVFFRIMIVFAASLVVFLSHDYLSGAGMPATEYYLLVLLATLGMMITAGAGHLLLLFLGIELMGLSFTLMVALSPGRERSKEASLKYLMYSLIASAILLFGLSLVFGLYGTWDLELIARLAGGEDGRAAALAMVMIIAGIGFKIGLVPFHMWIPDVYDGSPAPVAAFLAVGPKAAAFAAAVTIFNGAFGALGDAWFPVIWIMGVLSMFWGNVAALAQRSLKRMMAYSSIAHVGYLSIGLLAAASRPIDGLTGLSFYIFTYIFFNVGFFALIIWIEDRLGKGPLLDDVAGLGRRQPFIGAALALFLLSLAGIPPTAGFMGKLWIFMAAVRADMVGLAVIGVANSALAAYYYLRVIYYLFMKEEARPPLVPFNLGFYALILASISTLIFGIWPNLLIDILRRAALI